MSTTESYLLGVMVQLAIMQLELKLKGKTK
jgi:hypothetical protein